MGTHRRNHTPPISHEFEPKRSIWLWTSLVALSQELTLLSNKQGPLKKILFISSLWKNWNTNVPCSTFVILTPFIGLQMRHTFIIWTQIVFSVRNLPTSQRNILLSLWTLEVKPSSSSSTRDKCFISLSMINKSHHQNFSQRREKKYFKKNNCKHT